MHGTARVKNTKLTIFMIFCIIQHTKIKNEVKLVLFKKKKVTLSSASTNSQTDLNHNLPRDGVTKFST